MFFTRLRRRAKWVFLLLAIVFALGFVGFGVGAQQGNGISDYIRDLFGAGGGSSGPQSVEDARQQVAENPNDPQARLELAKALQAAGQVAAAIPQLEIYVQARPKDEAALQQLAALLGARGRQQQSQIAAAQTASASSALSQDLPTGDLAQTLYGGPITEQEQTETSTRVNTLVQEATATYAKQADAYQKLTKAQPDVAANYLQLGQAELYAGDTQAGIAAWEHFLKLAPDDPSAAIVRRQLKQLRASAATGG